VDLRNNGPLDLMDLRNSGLVPLQTYALCTLSSVTAWTTLAANRYSTKTLHRFHRERFNSMYTHHNNLLQFVLIFIKMIWMASVSITRNVTFA